MRLFFILLLFLSLNSSATQHIEVKKTKIKKAPHITENLISIKKQFQKINQTKTYQTITLHFFGHSTEGAVAIYYLKNNKIEKIVAVYLGETGRTLYELYYNNENLIFVLEQRYQYNRPIYWTTKMEQELLGNNRFEPKTEIFESRYYFSNLNLIQFIDRNQQIVEKNSQVFGDKRNKLLKREGFLRNLFAQKQTEIQKTIETR